MGKQAETLDKMFDGKKRAALLAAAAKAPADDAYLGGDLEKMEEEETKAAKASALAADQAATSGADNEIARLKEQLAEKNAIVEALEKKWTGQWKLKDYGPDHPFRVQIYSNTEDPAQNWPVSLSVNGQEWKVSRGDWVTLPRKAVEVLENAVIDSWIKIVDPAGNPLMQHVYAKRFPFVAQPL